MKTIGVRIDVPESLYNVLVQEQDRKRSATGKKVALCDIMLDYCDQWIRIKDNVLLSQITPQPSIHPYYNPPEPLNGPTPMQTKDLLDWEDRLRRWEGQLRDQAFDLIEKDKLVSEKSEKALNVQDATLKIKEAAQSKNTEIEIQKSINACLHNDIADKNEQISNLKNEIRSAQENSIRLLKNIDRKTEKDVFMDYIVPFLPTFAAVTGIILLKKDIAGMTEMNKFDKEIFDIYNGMNPEALKGFKDFVQALAKKYTENDNSEVSKKKP